MPGTTLGRTWVAASHLAGPTGWVEGQSLLALPLPPPQSVPPVTRPAGHLPIHSSAWLCQAFCRQFSLLSPSLSPFPAPAAFSEWCNCRTLSWPSVLQGRVLRRLGPAVGSARPSQEIMSMLVAFSGPQVSTYCTAVSSYGIKCQAQ